MAVHQIGSTSDRVADSIANAPRVVMTLDLYLTKMIDDVVTIMALICSMTLLTIATFRTGS